MKKITIFYTKAGGGHTSLATALKENLEKYYPEKYEIDFFDPIPSYFSKAYGYLNSDLSNLWGFLYKISDNPLASSLVQFTNGLLFLNSIKHYLEEQKPDLVVSNNQMLTYEVSHAINFSSHKCKLVVQIADPFSIHHIWTNFKDANLYVTPTAEASQIAIKRGILPEKVKEVGWLLRDKFLENNSEKSASTKQELQNELGLDAKKFTIFLGGSGQGGGKMYHTCKSILENEYLKNNCQIIAVTGRNPNVYQSLKSLEKGFNNFSKTLNVISYSDNISVLIGASDIVVGKAGPSFVLESIFMKTPILATGCLPGQEEGNLEFIKRENVGWVEKDIKKAILLLEKIVKNRELLKEKSKNFEKIRKQNENAGKRIADALDELLKQ